MVNTTAAYKKTLEKAGITITGANKLELDEEGLRNSNISTLKTLFTGYNSFANKMAAKGNTIANEAAGAGGTYTGGGKYNDTLSKLVSGRIDIRE
ncbi:MAG: hypothetical protein K5886_11415 [Lachnospiraceae bacterium]|nr:hypothetical protein [Lachnospiraceae bacterium]